HPAGHEAIGARVCWTSRIPQCWRNYAETTASRCGADVALFRHRAECIARHRGETRCCWLIPRYTPPLDRTFDASEFPHSAKAKMTPANEGLAHDLGWDHGERCDILPSGWGPSQDPSVKIYRGEHDSRCCDELREAGPCLRIAMRGVRSRIVLQ